MLQAVCSPIPSFLPFKHKQTSLGFNYQPGIVYAYIRLLSFIRWATQAFLLCQLGFKANAVTTFHAYIYMHMQMLLHVLNPIPVVGFILFLMLNVQVLIYDLRSSHPILVKDHM